MLPRPRTIVFARTQRAVWFVVTVIFSSLVATAEPNQTHVVCRESVSQSQREDLAKKLGEITGWRDLRFDVRGNLRLGSTTPVGGSPTARSLLERSAFGSNFIVLEDASRYAEVAFSRIIDGEWKTGSPDSPAAFVIQIDFADFRHVMGDRRALQAFDAGWVLLHELDHVVNNSVDSDSLGQAGDCEAHINQMRRESGLPERSEYFFSYLPSIDPLFNTRFVRLAFEQDDPRDRNRKRYWLIWDGKLVGGLDKLNQVAAAR